MRQNDLLSIGSTIQILAATDCRDVEFARHWCDVRESEGCRKNRECRKASRGQTHPKCWLVRAKNAWCGRLRGMDGSVSEPPNPTAILGPVCKNCDERGQYRDCEPCPYYGCLQGTDASKDGDDRLCPFAWCFSNRDGLTIPRPNPFRFLQCFVTRPEFREFQRSTLRLVAASYLYKDINDESQPTYYLMKNPIACLQFLSTDVGNGDKGWEPFADEQVRWHAIAAARKEQVGASLFKLLEAPKGAVQDPLTPRERQLGIICVEDGEFSAFLLRWMLLRMFQAQGGGLLSLRREVSVSLRAEENTLFEGLKAVGLAPARPTVENGRIQISVLDLFRDLGLIDGDARATPRMVMLVQWLADLTEAAGPPSLPARPLRARQRQADNIPGGHARILLGRPLGDADARKRRQRLRRALAWARSGEPDRNYQNINALVSVLVRCHDTSSGDDKEMTDIERACRFPLGAHYQVRQRFNTPLMWVVFPVLSYRTDPHMMGLEPRAGQRRPIGLFIGLRHQDILRPLNSRSLPALVGPLKAVASWLSVATNQDFLDTVLQKYVALSGAAFAGQAVAHIVNKPRHVSSRVLLDDGAVIQDAIVLTQDEWREITASSRTLMDLTNPAPQGTWPPFDVGQLVNETVTARQPSLTGMPIDIKVTTSGNCRILADREAVRLFVIRELLENAIRECDKYVRQLRKSRDLSGIGADSKGCIYFTIVQSVDGVCVRVENPAICDPCSRGVPVGYPRFDGVTWQGYGLMVARQVMRYFGGDLRWPPHRKEKLFKVEAYFRITQPKE